MVKITKYDKTASEAVRTAADFTCEICGIQDDTIQCMHDISRTYVITRYDHRNLISGCAKCHFATGKDPHYHRECFIKVHGAEEVQLNRERAHSGDRLKPAEKDEVRAHYQAEIKRIKQLRMDGSIGKIELEVPEILL